MNSAASWWGNLGMQSKFQILTQAFLFILSIACQQWIVSQFTEHALNSSEERARLIADGAINGLNTLMVTKIGGEDVISDKAARALFVQKMGGSEHVKEIRIIRDKVLSEEYDAGLPQEQPVDEMDRKVLASGKTEYEMKRDGAGATTMRAVVPYIAKENFRGTKCLKCHGVAENTVLGAASVTLDISDDIATIKKTNIWIWISLAAIQVILFVVIGLITRLAITRPLKRMRDAIVSIEKDKDFTQRMPTGGNDEIGQTTGAFNMMLERVQGALKEVNASVSRLRGAADSVSAAAKKVLAGSTEQCNSSTSMAAAIQEMTASIGNVSSNADDALTISRTSHEVSEVGGRIIGETVAGMMHISAAVHDASAAIESLGEQSRQITSVVQVIKEVADQTNLLALNAAIEAARAGESGRGFAVVADEVRKLAERTSKSTMEISAMVDGIQTRTDDAVREIKDVVSRVNEGQELAGQAGGKIAEIREHSSKVAASFSDITHALREQDTTSQDIAHSVENIARIADDNLTTAKSMATDVERLNAIARQVDDTVSIFKV